MTSVIFIHGTGGRKKDYDVTFGKIEAALKLYELDVQLIPCLWGDSLGAKLNANGVSIPAYQEKKLTPEEENILLWEALYKDPFYEIRLLGLRSPAASGDFGKLPPEKELADRVTALPQNAELQIKLDGWGIGKYFISAYEIITKSEVFDKLLETTARPLDDDYGAIARGIVAMSGLLFKEYESSASPLLDKSLRNKAVDAIFQALSRGEQSRGVIANWLQKLFPNLALGIGTYLVKRQRGALTDGAYPFAGDIMVYQAKGKEIRAYIRRQIEQAEPPVVLLAHSLGGVACVDLLIEEDLGDRVKLLITVGSQAPFLYEINALTSLDFGEPLPEHVPKWLNIYDLKDFLSYIGGGVFPDRVRDVQVNNQQPFPEAHGAYWATTETWQAIKEMLHDCGLD
jgi:hypothetical protein